MPKLIWRIIGVGVFFAMINFPIPGGLNAQQKVVLGMTLWMAIYWVSEAMPLAATSLIPLVVLPVFSILPMDQTAKFYSDPNIFLFMGGFFLALAMEKCALQKRVALHLIALSGTGPRGILGGFMFATAVISMWVSNTATTLMMLPIAMAVMTQFEKNFQDKKMADRFSLALMLGIAYASSIGGIATLVGTPPNMIFAGQVKALFPNFSEISFVQWMFLCFPISMGFLLLCWLYLGWSVCGKLNAAHMNRELIRCEINALGPWRSDEVKVCLIFFITVFAWIFRADIPLGHFTIKGWTTLLGIKGLHDGTIAMMSALLLFFIPSKENSGDTLLNWDWAVKIPWGVLLLFGGGFALAEGFQVSGLADQAANLFSGLKNQPFFTILLSTCAISTYGSELMSNSPQATLMMPVLASVSESLNLHPYWLMIPATLMTSLAFMMPAGTPPNAIVFSSGKVKIKDMIQVGFVLNLVAIVWVSVSLSFLLPKVFQL